MNYEKKSLPAVCRRPENEPRILSYSQQRLLLLTRKKPDSPIYNIPIDLRLKGQLNIAVLNKALNEIIHRHEILQMLYNTDKEEPIWVIHPEPQLVLEIVDLSTLSTNKQEAEIQRLQREEERKPFDLEHNLPIRGVLLCLNKNENILLLTIHHIAADEWSKGLLIKELVEFYKSLCDGKPFTLAKLAIQYSDFVYWQHKLLKDEVLEGQLAYWKEQLRTVPVPELPTDYSRPPLQKNKGDSHHFDILPSIIDDIRKLCRKEGLAPSIVLLTAFKSLLYKYSGKNEIAVGLPVSGRSRAEFTDLIGCFTHTLILKTDMSGNPSYLELLTRVQDVILGAYAHQDLPLEKLVDELKPQWYLNHSQLLNVIFNYNTESCSSYELPGLTIEHLNMKGMNAKSDLTFNALNRKGDISCSINYNTDLFHEDTIIRMAEHFQELLKNAVADPAQTISNLDILTESDRNRLTVEWNNTETEYPEEQCIQDLFEAQVNQLPDAVAVVFKDQYLTYQELNKYANRIACHFRKLGIGQNSLVGVWMDRMPVMIAGILGILKAGGAYVPMDSSWPVERVQLILSSLDISCILIDHSKFRAIHDIQWKLEKLTDIICLDVSTPDLPPEELNMDIVRETWNYVAEKAYDRVTAGGFTSSYTGKPFSEAEVDEYITHVVKLAEPYLGADKSVLEIGCGSGLVMFEISPNVERYTGLDPSELTQEHNRKKINRNNISNIHLRTGFAHDTVSMESNSFDLVILASTVQFFPGPVYLKQIIQQILRILKPGCTLLIADVLDLNRKEELRQSLENFEKKYRDYPDSKTKTDLDNELYIDKKFFIGLSAELGGIFEVTLIDRENGFKNELGYRYDVLLKKTNNDDKLGVKNVKPEKCIWTRWHLDQYPEVNLPSYATGDDIAYIIHTSGSTGVPKGVVVQHRPVVNTIDWVNKTFHVGSDDRLLFITSLCFDLSVYDIFGILASGGSIYIPYESDVRDPERLLYLLCHESITFWDSAPAALQQLVPLFKDIQPDRMTNSLRLVFLSGDWIPLTLPDNVRKVFQKAEVISLGGATEATIWSNYYPIGEVHKDWISVPYGKPIQNAKYYILDSHLNPCPVGVAGDLYIGGECLALGYANRPDLTSEKFIPDPFSNKPGSRMYQTGDRARFWPDGNIEFLGRIDNQVKIRGYRIELGEIEVLLKQMPTVLEAAVLALEDTSSQLSNVKQDKRLVAYVVLENKQTITTKNMRSYLKKKLPNYMIPSVFVILDAFPLTPNGKIDRKALPGLDQIEPDREESYAAPGSPTEEIVVNIWSEVLGLEKIGVGDNFLELGGHSLLATQIISRVRNTFKIELTLHALFETLTVKEMSKSVDKVLQQTETITEPIKPVSQTRELLLSFAQQRLWILDRLEPGNPTYNLPVKMQFSGTLDINILNKSLNELIKRHESLRTTFMITDGSPVQIISESLVIPLQLVDLREISAQKRETEVERLATEEALWPFDLTCGPLIRATLVRLKDKEYILLLNMHHIISDGWSIGIFITELLTLYRDFTEGKSSSLQELPVQYADFTIWQQQWLKSEVIEKQLSYWKKQLKGALNGMELQADYPRPPVKTYNGLSVSADLSKDLSRALKTLSKQEGCTLFITLLSAFKILLYRYTGQTDVIVGSPIAGRNRSEIEGLIGFFLNSLVLRTDLSGCPSFLEVLDRVREVSLAAYANQDLPFEKLLEELQPKRDLSRTPLFQLFFNMLNFPVKEIEIADLKTRILSYFNNRSIFDLTMYVDQQNDGIQLKLVFNSDLFTRSRMAEMLKQFEFLLCQIVEKPEEKISNFSLVTPFYANFLPDPTLSLASNWYGPVHTLFSRQAEQDQEKIAVVDREETWTYKELDRRSNQLANYFCEAGIKRQDIIAIYGHRSASLVWAVLGILKAGAAFTILDPAYPAARLISFLKMSTPRGWLQIKEAGDLPDILSEFLDTSSLKFRFTIPARSTTAETGLLKDYTEDDPQIMVGPDDLAFIAFTSGSTGIPKGILGRHGPLSHFIPWQKETFGLDSHDRYSMLSGLSHDPLQRDIFTSLSLGASLYVPDPEQIGTAGWLTEWMNQKNISIAHLTPAMVQLLSLNRAGDTAQKREISSLRFAFTVGDVLTKQDVLKLKEIAPFVTCVNFYGSTETQRAVGYLVIPDNLNKISKEIIPLGRGMKDVQLLVLNSFQRLAGIGEQGEVYVRSPHLAKGYLGDDTLTQKRFITNPFTMIPEDRLYRTGDLGSYLPDCNVVFQGRADLQVKIRGFRIELGEVEAVLNQYPDVQEAAVIARGNKPDNKYLAAYIVPKDGQIPAVKDIRHFLKDKIPEYMIPSAFVMLKALPLTPNGKVDRRALPEPDQVHPELEQGFVGPRTQAEKKLADIWSKILDIKNIGIHNNFFELGGHSLLAIQLVSAISNAFKVELPLRSLFESPTVAGLIELVQQCEKNQSDYSEIELPVIIPDPLKRYESFPLTDIQQAYWIGRRGDIELGNIATHSYYEYEIAGLDIGKYEQAWQRLIKRHEMLRAIIEPNGEQRILKEVPAYKIKVLNLQDQSADEAEARLMKVREEMSHRVLPTDRWPLFDIRASLLRGNRVRLHISTDLLIRDAWSAQILKRELDISYNNPEVSLPDLELSFRDYVLAEKSFRKTEQYKQSLEYWKERVHDLAPAPELPIIRNRANLKQPRFVRRRSSLGQKAWKRLKIRAAQLRSTPSLVLLTAFAEVLGIWSKNERFTLNLTLFNRLPIHPQVNEIVGDFTSLILLEVEDAVRGPFQDRVRKIQERLWEDLEHRYVSGVQVLRELGRQQGGMPRALMPVVFTSTLVHSFRQSEDVFSRDSEVNLSRLQDIVYSVSQTPQVWLDHQVSEWDGELVFSWDAIEELFPKGLLDDMFEAYCSLLKHLSGDDESWPKEYQLVPSVQLEKRTKVNATTRPVSKELLHTLFAKQVEKQPDQTAVFSPGLNLSYEKLFRRSNQVGRWLRNKGIKPNQLVGVVMEKGWEQIVAVLGILQSGAAYLPINPQLPTDRIEYLLKNGEVEWVLSQPWIENQIDWPEVSGILSIKEEGLEGISEEPLETAQESNDLAYVIFTSGSTGYPKGVMIEHGGAVNTILDINERFRIRPSDRVLCLSSLSFDLSVYDIFGLLAAGGSIVLSEPSGARDPGHWLDLIDRFGVTLWDTVPALMEMLVEYVGGIPEQLPPSLRLVFMSGDWVPLNLPDRIKSLGKDIEVYSGGGATEGSIWSIMYEIKEVDPNWVSIPYGNPLSNQTFHVYDSRLKDRPVWVPGELYIGGSGVARGYWKDKEKTDSHFIIHPDTGKRLYHTGDMGRYLPDGNIEFLGREDFQVKIRGYRIELGEIESVLCQHPKIQSCVVTTEGDPRGDKHLLAYVVPEESFRKECESPQNILVDPLERLMFKLQRPGLRQMLNKRESIRFNKPVVDKEMIAQYVNRRSYRQFSARIISLDEMGGLLSNLKPLKLEGVPLPKYIYGSAGSLYPVQTYVYVKPGRIEGLEGGPYYYDPEEHAMVLLSSESHIDRDAYAIGNNEIFDSAAFALFFVAQQMAILPMYGDLSHDFCMLEAGLMTQLLEMRASEYGIGICQIGDFHFEPFMNLFSLEEGYEYLHGLVGGALSEEQTGLESLIKESGELQELISTLQENGEKIDSNNTSVTAGEGITAGESITAGKNTAAGKNILIEELKEYLGCRLPDYMVPASITVLDEIPLTPNGKIDWKALPKPELIKAVEHKEFRAPRSELECIIAQIWREVLKREKIGIYDNFLDIGGNSLHIIQVYNKIREKLNFELKIVKLFEYPTIDTLTRYLKEITEGIQHTEQSMYESIKPVKEQEYYPISAAQKRMFILYQLEKESTYYNEPLIYELEGELNRKKLESAFNKLIERQESFRTQFETIDEEPVQRIIPEINFKLEYIKAEETQVKEVIKEFIKPFDLNKAPLIRAGIISLSKTKNIMMIDVHHIIADGVSVGIFTDELSRIYNGKKLKKQKIQYKDFSSWQNNELLKDKLKKQKQYWLNIFSDELPILTMPTDYPRPVMQSFEGSNIKFELTEETSEKLKAVCKANGATLYMTLFAVYNILLHRYTGQEDIIVGSPTAGRGHTDLDSIVGMFVNTLALRTKINNEKNFMELLREVKTTVLNAFDNQDYQFEKLIEKIDITRDTSRNPLFDTMFVLQNMGSGSIELEGLKISRYDYDPGISKFDLTLFAIERDERIVFYLEYCTKLFQTETIQRLAGHFINLIQEIVNTPEKPIRELEMLFEEEKNVLLYDFNKTKSDYPDDKTIHGLFEEQVEKTPSNTAVVFEDKKLSYEELNKRANRLARLLRKKGIKPDSIVGIMVERSLEMIIGILGILKAGGAYLPIDPDYPEHRKKFMLDDSDTSILLTQTRFKDSVKTDALEIIDLETIDSDTGSEVISNLEITNKPTDLAYVIYTSGSTGKPKGVMIEHKSLINRLNWMQKRYPLSETDTILQKTPFVFDVSVWEMFWWSIQGAKVCFLIPGGEKNPDEITRATCENKITVMHFVPSMLTVFLEYVKTLQDKNKISSLKKIFSSGESLTSSQVKMFNEYMNKTYGTTLDNLYGPTEATIDVSYFECTETDDLLNIPIGKPIDNIKLYVLSKNNNLQPVKVTGELCISGVGLARGYLNREELTKERFTENPFIPGERMYRTGDLARWLPDGNIEFLGRLDHQVKIRGFRIELGEIETTLLDHGDIKETIVTAREDEQKYKYLCAYVVSDREVPASELRDYLSKKLPDYMIPSHFIQLDRMPLTPNGKIDRKMLEKAEQDKVSFQESPASILPNITDWFYIPSWKRTMPPILEFHIPRSRLLVFSNGKNFSAKLVYQLQAHGHEVIVILAGKKFAVKEDTFTIRADNRDDYRKLISELSLHKLMPNHIVHLWNLDTQIKKKTNLALNASFYSLLFLVQAIRETDNTNDLSATIISSNLHQITNTEKIHPEKATLLGPCKVITQEIPHTTCRSIDIVPPRSGSQHEVQVVQQIITEIEGNLSDEIVAYRGYDRWIQTYEPSPLCESTNGDIGRVLHSRGVYLMIGEPDNTALAMAEYLVKKVQARLIFVTQYTIPDLNDWENWLKTHDSEDPISSLIYSIQKLKDLGGQILIICADIGNKNQMKEMIRAVNKRFDLIHGVIYTAAPLEGKIMEISDLQGRRLDAQIQNILIIEDILQNIAIDFMLLCTPLEAVTGGEGQVTKCAVNAFMDAYARACHLDHNTITMSISWGLEGDFDMINILDRIFIRNRSPQLAVCSRHLPTILERNAQLLQKRTGMLTITHTDVEKELTDIWQQLLGIDKVGRNDSFFRMGGHSLVAIQLINRVRDTFKVDLPYRTSFKSPTIADLAKQIELAKKKNPDQLITTIKPRSGNQKIPLSLAQKQLCFLEQCSYNELEKAFITDGSNHNLIFTIRLSGKIDTTALEQSLHEIEKHHEILRTTISIIDEDIFQVISQDLKTSLQLFDLKNLTKDEQEDQITLIIDKELKYTFDLTQRPLWKTFLFQLGQNKHVLLMNLHRIIFDERSISIILDELSSSYNSSVKSSAKNPVSDSTLPELMIQYADYAVWQNDQLEKGVWQEHFEYWEKQLTGELPVLNLAAIKPNSLLNELNRGKCSFLLSQESTEMLKSLSMRKEVTLFITLLAAFKTLLHVYTKQNDILVGTPVDNRKYSEIERLIGLFGGIVPLRTDLSGDPSFQDLLERVKKITLEALAYQDVPIEMITEKLGIKPISGYSFIQVIFMLQNEPAEKLEFTGLTLNSLEAAGIERRYDLSLTMEDIGLRLKGVFRYNANLFHDKEIDTLTGHFQTILREIAMHPEYNLSDLSF